MSSFPPDSLTVGRIVPSPNHEPRVAVEPDMLVLHYTGMECTHDALDRLCDSKAKVSSHYLVFEGGEIVQLVPEILRAYHAGASSWEGTTDINSRSIGIEVGNTGHDFGCPEFPDVQIDAVIALCRDIVSRRSIRADRVLGHSDVAPSRKCDPGEKFPWRRLGEAGVGLWVEPGPLVAGAALALGDRGAAVTELQRGLAGYGYGLAVSGIYDAQTQDVVTAFQRHFRPARVDGVADHSTVQTLRALLSAKPAIV